MNKKLLNTYGLTFNPFTSDLPIEALYINNKLEHFFWRIENIFIQQGGFALISGDPGTGKSVTLRLLEAKLNQVRDIQVGVLTHSSTNISDFYRELGDIFGVPLTPYNLWNSFKHLRSRWLNYMENAMLRPVLLIDEAQEMPNTVMNELRLLTSSQFDSHMLLSIVLAGDKRLNNKLRHDELVSLGSRIKVRLNTEYVSAEQLQISLQHLLDCAGNSLLMTPELIKLLCEHSMGNYRVLSNLASDLLAAGAQKQQAQLDEKLYFECFSLPKSPNKTTRK